MTDIRKFTFDLDFDESHTRRQNEPEPEPVPDLPPAPVFSEEELEQARHQAFEAGKRAGRQEALGRIEQSAALTLEQLAGRAAELLEREQLRWLEAERAAVRLALAGLRHILPEAARRHALGEIEALVAECLAERGGEPRLVIRVADALVEPLRPRLEAVAAGRGYEGRLVVIGDAALEASDARVEWPDGGAERLLADAEERLATIARRMTGDDGPGGGAAGC